MTDQTAGTGETQTTQATETNATDTTSQATQTTDTTQTADTTQTTQTDVAKPLYPDDWREKWAGGDPKALSRLQRFPSPDAVFKSFRELETKLSSGQFKTPLPENPTPEQIAEYRQANGIPNSPAEYKVELSDGLVIGESDKPLVDGILEAAHAANASPAMINAVLDEYYHMREEQIEADQIRAEQEKSTMISTLTAEWGADFKPNMRAVMNTLVTHLGQDQTDLLLTAKLADGSIVGNNIHIAKGLAALAKELNPAGTMVPNAGGDQVSAISDQIKEYEKKISTNITAWQHPSNKADRDQYSKLLEARDKLKARGH